MIGTILIVITFGTSQAYQRANEDFPQVTMQRFADAKSCQFAAQQIWKAAGGEHQSRIRAVCVPEGISK